MSTTIPASTRISASLIGALVCIAVLTTLLFLGSGLGMSVRPDEKVRGAALIYLSFSLLGSYFAGGYAASRLDELPFSRNQASWSGLAVWASASVFALIFLVVIGTSSLGPLLVGTAVAAGNEKGGIAGTLEQLEKLHPRIVSDIKLSKGKVVTVIETSDSGKKQVKENAKQAAGEAREAISKGSLLAFFGLAAAAGSAVFGAVLGRRRGVRRDQI